MITDNSKIETEKDSFLMQCIEASKSVCNFDKLLTRVKHKIISKALYGDRFACFGTFGTIFGVKYDKNAMLEVLNYLKEQEGFDYIIEFPNLGTCRFLVKW